MKAFSPFLAGALTPLALLLCLGFSSPAAGEAPESLEPVFTNKTRFRIPFRYDAGEMQRIGAKEIRLYLTVDQGKTWKLSRQANPQAGKFDFEAAAPGEYWFAVRTLDGRNQLYPPSQVLTPGLKVVVDTTPPTLAIQLGQAQAGKVKMSWQANDPNLDLSTLRLEYIQGGADRWEMVSIVPQANGQTAWSVPQGGFVAVRGQIFDRAGNVQQAQSQVRIEPSASVPNLNDPIASPPVNNSVVENPNAAPSNPFESAAPQPPSASPSGPSFDSPPQNSFVSSHSASPATQANSLPPKISKDTRVVNARRFHIAYKVDDVGPSGVGDVELYITEDDGAKWYKYGSDPDRKSPFQVETPRDGIYGFALRVHSGAGLAADPPRPGEKPSIVVVVDNTPPSVKLLSADQGRGKNLNQVVLRWSVTEDHPAEQPISLAYTNDPNGRWEPIAGWMADTGEFVWNAGPKTPSRLYFRVTARDAAGNLDYSQTTEPVIVDLAKPSAQIVDVETLEGSNNPRR